jgi:hypothetical protein
MENILIALFTEDLAETKVIGEEIVGIASGDCAVKISEEDVFGRVFHGREVADGAHLGQLMI